MSLEKICKKLTEPKKLKLNDIYNVIKNKKIIFKKIVKKDLFYPGAFELINNLKNNNIKIAMVTSSHRSQLNKSLSIKNLNLFDYIVCGDEVKKNKPYPDPYLQASKKLKIQPSECLVFENAPIGIKSAKKAKMKVIAVTNTLKSNNLAEANIIISSFRDLKYMAIFKSKLKNK